MNPVETLLRTASMLKAADHVGPNTRFVGGEDVKPWLKTAVDLAVDELNSLKMNDLDGPAQIKAYAVEEPPPRPYDLKFRPSIGRVDVATKYESSFLIDLSMGADSEEFKTNWFGFVFVERQSVNFKGAAPSGSPADLARLAVKDVVKALEKALKKAWKGRGMNKKVPPWISNPQAEMDRQDKLERERDEDERRQWRDLNRRRY